MSEVAWFSSASSSGNLLSGSIKDLPPVPESLSRLVSKDVPSLSNKVPENEH